MGQTLDIEQLVDLGDNGPVGCINGDTLPDYPSVHQYPDQPTKCHLAQKQQHDTKADKKQPEPAREFRHHSQLKNHQGRQAGCQ